MKNEKSKNILLAVLLVAVVTLTIAYALLSTTLTINAQATVKGANWDVHFQNKSGVSPVCTASSRDGAASTTASVTQPPTIDSTSFTGLEVEFRLPGDKVVCTWQVTNAGSIDAKLATFTKPSTYTYTGQASDSAVKTADEGKVSGHINYTLTIDGNAPVAGTDVLPATSGNTKDVVLTIEFDPNATQLPTNDVIVTGFDTTLVYEQN